MNEERSGLVASDSLTTGGTGQWIFSCSAPVEGGIGTYSENGSGLYLGVLARTAGTYAGVLRENVRERGRLQCCHLSSCEQDRRRRQVQHGPLRPDGGPRASHMLPAAVVERIEGPLQGRRQGRGGREAGGDDYSLDGFEANQDQPLTRDCTIVTNGQNLLEVDLDHKLVYSNSSMDLEYQYPLSARVEVQSNDNSTMRFGPYLDFYVVTSDNVTVTHVPVAPVVRLVSPSGRVYFSKTAGASGTVQIGLAAFAMPLIAYVRVVYLGRTLATSRQPAEVWGGDAYTFGPLGVYVALHRSGRGPEADPRAAARAPQSWRKRSP